MNWKFKRDKSTSSKNTRQQNLEEYEKEYISRLEQEQESEFFFPCAMGILGQPEGDFTGQRLAGREEPVHGSAVPRLGDPDPSSPVKVKFDSDSETPEMEVDRWELKGDFLVRKH